MHIPQIKRKSIASFIISVIRPYPIALLTMVMVSLTWAISLSISPYLLKLMIDRVTQTPVSEIVHVLFLPALLYVLVSLALNIGFRCYDYFVCYKMIPVLRKRIADHALTHLLQHSHKYYQNQFSGSLGTKVSELLMTIPVVLQMIIDRFFSHTLALIIAVATLWTVSPRFALVMMIWSGLFTIGGYFYAPHLTALSNAWATIGATASGKIVDVLGNILSVRLFARPQQEMQHLGGAITEAVVAEQKLEWAYFKMWMLYGFSYSSIQAINLYFLIIGYQEGWITIGDFALVLSINSAVVEFLWQLTKEFSQFTKQYGRITQAYDTIFEPLDLVNAPDATDLSVPRGEIVFDKVAFTYPQADLLFSKKSVVIRSGEKVGLVGESGSGKTTFVNLILRLFDISAGRILIDGQDIRHVTLDSLRSAIALIPQDPSLFHRSLMDNIRYGNLDATDEEVRQAARLAHADAFIEKLPDGYASLVGERGVKLSGGQRQRIAIARAILKNAPILILDEATSQLDSITEGDIQESLWPVMQGRTTVVVAHRLSTLLTMDRILVFSKGKIVEDGTHEELLARNGAYTRLWNAQVGGFLPS